jgi:monofunctional glycosyltransferase
MSAPSPATRAHIAIFKRAFAFWLVALACTSVFANSDSQGLAELRALGFSWTSDERSGLTWKLQGVKGPLFTADTAELTLDTPPELVLSDVVVTLGPRRRSVSVSQQRDEDEDETEPTGVEPLPLPTWLVTARLNNVSVRLRGRTVLTGLNASLIDGQLKVHGRHVNAQGTVDLASGKLTAVGAITHPRVSARVEVDVVREATWPLALRLRQLRFKGEMVGNEPLRLDGLDVHVGRRHGHWSGFAELASMRVSFGVRCEPSCGVYAALDVTQMREVLRQLDELQRMTSGADVQGALSGEAWFVDGKLDLTAALSGFSVRGTDVNFEQYRYGMFQYPVWLGGTTLAVRTSGEGSSKWLSLDEIGPTMPAAVKAAEDLRFDRHPGFDVPATLEVVEDVVNKGRRWRGGSTITQQLVKNLLLNPSERSLQRKLDEWLIAAELDRELGKDRVMALYLNIVEWGPGIRGVASASRYYLDKEPAALSAIEAAWLATALPSPRHFHAAWQHESEGHAARVRWVLRNMARLNVIGEAELESGLLAKLPRACDLAAMQCTQK